MKPEAFKKKIEKELKTLDRKQIVQFAWCCAVRTLPFLGGAGTFNFWEKENRQESIYAIFYALDFTVAYATSNDDSDAAYATTFAAAYAATAAAANAVNAAAAFAPDAYSYAAAYAASATNSAFSANSGDASNASFDATAASDASFAAFSSFTSSSVSKLEKLQYIILDDIIAIRKKGGRNNKINLDLYGEIWSNFQNTLKVEGCSYWGKLYQSIFESGFILDKEALNRRLNVPKEIRNRGAAAVANYLKELEEKGATHLNEARIIILGDKGSGKTCLARRLVDPNALMTTPEESTAGVDTSIWKLEKENINVRIWDFAGHTVTHAVHQFFLSERSIYIMVYDGRTEERNRLEYWLNHMKNYGGESKAFIIVNKRDHHSVEIPINKLIEQYPIEGGLHVFSIGDDKIKLEEFRNELVKYIKNNPSWNKQEIPLNYFKVKEELERLFENGNNEKEYDFITKETFQEIAKKNDVDDIEELLKDLHFLGISLWYKEMEDYNTLVLNPEWISYGVYKIINWVNEEEKYSLTLDDFAVVFTEDADRYPVEQCEFLFKLMKHYELAYETKKGNELIIPHLLKEDRPKILPTFPVGNSLMLRYKAEQPLPSNTISRFIVRHNQNIKKDKNEFLVWRYGIVLKDNRGNIALVREDDRTISVSVKGKGKKNYLSTLRDTLNDIFDTYKSERPELQYRVEQLAIKKGQIPIWVAEEVIQNHVIAQKTTIYDSFSNQNIPIQLIIEKLNINLGSGNMTIVGNDIDNSTHNTFNFQDCNFNLQGNFNDLASLLNEGGYKDEAKELENAALALEQAEKCKTPEEVKKKGIAKKLQRLVMDLGNEDSKLHKKVKSIKHGIGVAQDIAKSYNDIAQWMGLPQVPKPFLK